MSKTKFGTKEWAEVNKNIQVGCEHDCRYCYARYNAMTRLKKIKDAKEWTKPVLDVARYAEKPRKYRGRIMFPTQHDITGENVYKCSNYLQGWLEAGNNILIVSKPHYMVIRQLCEDLEKYKDQIVFRFTIGSMYDSNLKFWEPNAPDYAERKKALKYAFDHGFKTSVSVEPMLDRAMIPLVEDLLPYITDTIWLGKMNFVKPRVDTTGWTKDDFVYMNLVQETLTDSFVHYLYDRFKDNPKVKWKESIKKVLNLPDEEGVA